MFHLCPASKAAVRQEKYPAHVRGRNGVTGRFFYKPEACITTTGRDGVVLVTRQRLVLRDRTAGAVFFTSRWLALHGRDGGGIVKNAVKLFWNVVDVGFLHYLCLEIIK